MLLLNNDKETSSLKSWRNITRKSIADFVIKKLREEF